MKRTRWIALLIAVVISLTPMASIVVSADIGDSGSTRQVTMLSEEDQMTENSSMAEKDVSETGSEGHVDTQSSETDASEKNFGQSVSEQKDAESAGQKSAEESEQLSSAETPDDRTAENPGDGSSVVAASSWNELQEADQNENEVTTETLEFVELRDPKASGRSGVFRIAAGTKSIQVTVIRDNKYYQYYGGNLNRHVSQDGDSLYCVERVKSSRTGTYNLSADYWDNNRVKSACAYVIANGQQKYPSQTNNLTYSTGDAVYDYAVTNMAVWGVLDYYHVQVDTGGVSGDRNAGFTIQYQELTTGHGVKEKATQLFNDAIAYAEAHPDSSNYVTPEVSIEEPADVTLQENENGDYQTDLYTLTAKYGAAPAVTLSGDVPEGAAIQKETVTDSGYTFRVVMPRHSAELLTRGYEFRVQAGEQQESYEMKLYRQTSAAQAVGSVVGTEIQNANPASARVRISPPAWITLMKKSSSSEMTENNSCYSLEGAVYGIYSDQACSTEIGRLTTQKDGSSDTARVPSAGTYYVKEIQASSGYQLDTSVHEVILKASSKKEFPYVLQLQETPGNDPAAIEIQKVDSEGRQVQGGATLEGTQFTVCYYKGWYTGENLPEKPDRTWVLQTRKQADGSFRTALTDKNDYLVSGDDFYKLGDQVVLPLGTVTIEETKAAEGYLPGNRYTLKNSADQNTEISAEGKFVGQIRAKTDEQKSTVGYLTYGDQAVTEDSVTASDEVKRGDLQFKKIDENGKQMSFIPFLITSVTTGEKHVIVSDENGIVSTAAGYRKHTLRTNGLDAYSDGKSFKTEDKLHEITGIWFGSSQAVSDERGALPYDTYEIRELQCQANKGKELIVRRVNITEEGGTVWLDPAMNPDIALKTTAVETSTGSHSAPADLTVTIEDTVSYSRLTPGRTYTLKGKLVRKDDRDLVTATAEKTFRPEKSKGTVVLKFTVNTAGLDGAELVAMETLYWDGLEIAEHADLDDEAQTVRIPKLRTTASDEKTGTHTGRVAEKTTISDLVNYQGLDPEKTYTLTGTLYNRETGDALKDQDGKKIQAVKTFRPRTSEGTVTLKITLDSRLLAGKSVVTFEDLKDGGITVAVHADLRDEEQTVFYPEIGTKATDKTTEGKLAAVSEKTVFTDTVEYHNLVPETEYMLQGTLMDRETGRPVKIDGKEVTSSRSFTPSSADGSEEITFTFSAISLEGRSLVVFEKLFQSGAEVTAHENLEDEDQTIQVPGIKTTAADGQTDSHTGTVTEKAVIRDHVVCSNLLVGKTYTLRGTLMRKDTAKPLQKEDGTEASAETTFTAERKNTEIDLVFSFSSALLGGNSVVAFETLLQEDVEVAVHADLNDEDQTVHYPSVKTRAETEGKKETQASGKTRLTDHITCTNLVPGTTYRLTGKVYKKSDGGALKVDGKEITGEKTFTASAETYEVDMTFSFRSSELAGQTLVVFENLYQDEILVASHADLQSADQSVLITRKPNASSGSVPKTGDPFTALPWILLLSAAATGIWILAGKLKKNQ